MILDKNFVAQIKEVRIDVYALAVEKGLKFSHALSRCSLNLSNEGFHLSLITNDLPVGINPYGDVAVSVGTSVPYP